METNAATSEEKLDAIVPIMQLRELDEEGMEMKPKQPHYSGFSAECIPAPCQRATTPGEIKRTLQSLKQNLDGSSKKAALHTITQCIFLKESEASACTYEDITLVASFLDDPDEVIKTEALNALKAFSSILKFRIKIQEYIPKIIELVVRNWGGTVQAAGLRLMNGLDIPNDIHPVLKRLLPNFMDILLTADTLTKVQVLKFLNTVAKKEDLLYDIMNYQASPEFFSLFQSSLPGKLLYEVLVFVEQLSEKRLTSQNQSVPREYNNLSLHNILFGKNSRLSDHLLALIIHPEEEVHIQASKVILSLHLNKEENKAVPFGADISIHPLESTRTSHLNEPSTCNLPFSSSITSSPTANIVIVDASFGDRPLDDPVHNFQPLQGTNDSYSFGPLETSGNNAQALDSISVSSQPFDSPNSSPEPIEPVDTSHPIAAADSDED